MKTDKYLDKLKKIYSQTQPSSKMAVEGWEDLQSILDPRPWAGLFNQRNFLYGFFSLLLIAGVLLGVAQASQAALPGDLLYPVKRLSEKIVTSVTKNNKKNIENRAKEIIDLKKRHDEDTIRLQQAVQEYERAVQETEKKTEEDKNSQQRPDKKEDENKTDQIKGESDGPSQQPEDQNDSNHEEN